MLLRNPARLLPPVLLLVGLLTGRPAHADDLDPVGEWPLRPQPTVIRSFEPPVAVWALGHRGVDLLGGFGQQVHAALPGSVTFAGRLAGRGVIVVGHGDTRTTYEPVSAVVRVGDRVDGGDFLGRLQLAGSHCLPRACLHWGWRRGDTYLDPLGLFGGRPVRLLPLWRDVPVSLASVPLTPVPRPAPMLPYALVIERLERLAQSQQGRGQARGCACW